MAEAQDRIDRRQKVHRVRECERLAGDIVGIVSTGRIRPGVGWRDRVLSCECPRWIGHPGAAAGFADVEEGVVHADGSCGGNDRTKREQLSDVHHHDLIEVRRFGSGGDIDEGRCVLTRNGADEETVMPGLGGAHATINAVGGEIADV